MTIDQPGSETALLEGRWSEAMGVISPDGRFLAYGNLESGVAEVYVREYPSLRNPVRVTSGSGRMVRHEALWSPDSRTIYDVRMRDGAASVWAYPIDMSDGRTSVGQARSLSVIPPGTRIVGRHRVDGRWLEILPADAVAAAAADPTEQTIPRLFMLTRFDQ